MDRLELEDAVDKAIHDDWLKYRSASRRLVREYTEKRKKVRESILAGQAS